MLSCEKTTALLFDFQAGELPPAQHAAVAAHLQACPECAAFLRTYVAVAPMVQAALEVEVDDALQAELDAAVMEAIRRGA